MFLFKMSVYGIWEMWLILHMRRGRLWGVIFSFHWLCYILTLICSKPRVTVALRILSKEMLLFQEKEKCVEYRLADCPWSFGDCSVLDKNSDLSIFSVLVPVPAEYVCKTLREDTLSSKAPVLSPAKGK